MKLRFIWIGKTRNINWRSLQEDYLSRLEHFAKCEVVEIRDSKPPDKEIEGKRILEILNQNSFVIALDTAGTQVTSVKLSEMIGDWQSRSIRELCFIIGGADGISAEVRNRADYMLSLSFLTFTHEMARVILLEQIYRGYSILKGFPYQK